MLYRYDERYSESHQMGILCIEFWSMWPEPRLQKDHNSIYEKDDIFEEYVASSSKSQAYHVPKEHRILVQISDFQLFFISWYTKTDY